MSGKLRLLKLRHWFYLCLLLLLSGCGSHAYHVVERGETLYSIGWIYGYDYHQIARWNNIRPPYALRVGQHLKVTPPTGSTTIVQDYSQNQGAKNKTVTTTRQTSPRTASSKPSSQSSNKARPTISTAKNTRPAKPDPLPAVKGWNWPTKSRNILSTFLASDPSRQGVDIGGARGNPVYAAANGRVVYAGSGLPRYGRLIIVKHNELFLSAYAHNHRLRVKEGEAVKAGQKIADMGSTGTNRPKLYFEIRRNGKPVDPLRYLPK